MVRRIMIAMLAASFPAWFDARAAVQGAEQPMRLYVFDGGVLESDPARYRLKPDEVATSQLSVAAFLIVHPRGTLMWDTGAIADDTWMPEARPRQHPVLSNSADR